MGDRIEKLKSRYDNLRRKLWWFTPIGKSHNELLKSLGEEPRSERYRNYKKSFDRYRYTKRIEISIRILLYAGLISSVAASFGLDQLRILQSIAAYIGISLLLLVYIFVSYFNLIAREEFYLRRDLLVMEKD